MTLEKLLNLNHSSVLNFPSNKQGIVTSVRALGLTLLTPAYVAVFLLCGPNLCLSSENLTPPRYSYSLASFEGKKYSLRCQISQGIGPCDYIGEIDEKAQQCIQYRSPRLTFKRIFDNSSSDSGLDNL